MKHPYLSDNICIVRLIEEYEKYGSLVVAYDFDNCVYDYHLKGHDYSEVIALIRQAKEAGCYLIVFTASQDLPKVADFLYSNDIPYDKINENPPFYKSNSRKIYYNILLDDRAGLLSAYKQLKTVINHIKTKNYESTIIN